MDSGTATFIPFSIDVVDGRSIVRWIERAAGVTTEPFFAQMIRARLEAGAPQHETSLERLLTVQGPDPIGLVLHLSRCGSTLLMQSLAHAGCIASISEATPVNQLLARDDIPPPERAALLRGLLRALGSRDAASDSMPSLVKFTSWNVLFLDIVRAALPNTPWLFLYREPLEAIASHSDHPAAWLADDRFLTALTRQRRLPPLAGLAREPYCAAVLAAYGRAALDAGAGPANLMNYEQLPAGLPADVPARFGISTSAAQQADIAAASRIYSKDVSRQVVFDLEDERRGRPITDGMRDADRQYTRSIHAALERRRVGTADHA